MPSDPSPPHRRPRLILLGEFSAGKSTLANALMGHDASPIRVTATHVPPLWYEPGAGDPVCVMRDGTERALPSGDVADAPLADTRFVRVFGTAPILKTVELLDMPGSSDPNMDPAIWDALLPQADGAVWCTPATQAWRQSEAALWEEMPQTLRDNGLLLITRMDKVARAEDRARVLHRVQREAGGLFRAVLPVSLTDAIAAGQDEVLRAEAGLTAVCEALGELTRAGGAGARTETLRAGPTAQIIPLTDAAPPAEGTARAVLPRRVSPLHRAGIRRARGSASGSLL